MLVDSKKKLIEYFKKNIAKGYTIESLKIALAKQGYSSALIERAIEDFNKELAKKAPVVKEKPRIKYQIIDEHDNPVTIKKTWLEKLFGL